jgi:hypothetical protein
MNKHKNILYVGLFAVAMAYLEAAVVVYLRAMYGIEDLLRDINLTPDIYTVIETGREAATIVMLAAASLIAAYTWQKRIGYFFIAFGIWDIFYYIWLYVFIQWPKSLFEWDILFLIPLPWWGPVIAPVLISVLLISTGYFLITGISCNIKLIDWILISLSIIVILYTFMEDSLGVLFGESGNIYEVLPTGFNWFLFSIAFFIWVVTTVKIFYQSGRK